MSHGICAACYTLSTKSVSIRQQTQTARMPAFWLKQPLLGMYQDKLKDCLGTAEAVRERHCAGCGSTERLWQTEPGRIEYEKLGLCEPCWDCLMLPGMSAQKQLRQCSLLTADGLAVVKHVISACMGMEAVGIEQESDFRHAVSVALGQRPLTCPRR